MEELGLGRTAGPRTMTLASGSVAPALPVACPLPFDAAGARADAIPDVSVR
jgi:hypothetical protein